MSSLDTPKACPENPTLSQTKLGGAAKTFSGCETWKNKIIVMINHYGLTLFATKSWSNHYFVFKSWKHNYKRWLVYEYNMQFYNLIRFPYSYFLWLFKTMIELLFSYLIDTTDKLNNWFQQISQTRSDCWGESDPIPSRPSSHQS